MSMQAELTGVGPFKREVADCLNYPVDHYKGVPEGTMMLTVVVACETSTQSEAVAKALGFSPWDFSKHHIKRMTTQQAKKLGRALHRHGPHDADERPEFCSDCDQIMELVSAGWQFFYDPHG